MAGSRIPGPIGMHTNKPFVDNGTLALASTPLQGPVGAQSSMVAESGVGKVSEEEGLLAAVIYGEGSSGNVFEEMAAIAAVLVRQASARGFSVLGFLKSDQAKTFTFVLTDGNPRFQKFKQSKPEDIAKDAGMTGAVRAARHALSKQTDFSGGGYFWDGADLKTNFALHPKVLKGIRFSKPEHDIYKVGGKTIKEVVKFWEVLDAKGQIKQGKERGRFDCTYESTAACGGTVFWRYTPEYLQATGGKEYK